MGLNTWQTADTKIFTSIINKVGNERKQMYVAAVVLENGAVASLSNGILRFSREYMELIRDRANDEGFNLFGPI